ncbi:MAG: histidinol-phosphate transaminase [Anaerolineae bacterium]|nr:histidinol-phosphate transaminase [Anaerolineae bacterium]MDW8069324.1 histidinol-phosphate transaminase [Anaerolineae bacterium]
MSPVQPQRGLTHLRPYVPGKPIEEVQREYGLTDVVKMASNENPLGPSPRAMRALAEEVPRLHLYPDSDSYELRHALARHLGVQPEQVIAGNGADGVIVQTCLAYLDDGDEVIVGHPSFSLYEIYTHVMRARLVPVPLRDYRLDLEGMAAAITERTKIIFVCNPNNPTGTIVTADEVSAFMARVPDHVLVVFDEAYYEFVHADNFPDTLTYVREGRDNVLVIRTFSKIYGLAGVRLGYGVAQPEVLAPLLKVKEPFAVNRLAQAAGIAALEDDGFLEATIAATVNGRQVICRGVQRLGLSCIPSHTNFVLVRIGPHAGEVARRLLERGIIVRPCDIYDLPEFLRITIGTPAQNARFLAALEEALK